MQSFKEHLQESNKAMTPARAKELLGMTQMMSDTPRAYKVSWSSKATDPKGITSDEDQYIRAVWKTMPDSTSYNDALRKIAKGEGLSESVLLEANLSNDEKTLLQKMGNAIKGKSLMSLRGTLELLGTFKKADIDFVTSPIPTWMIKYKGNTIVILNKKYVDKPDVEVGELALGILR